MTDKRQIIIYAFIAAIAATVLYVCSAPVTDAPPPVVIADAIAAGVLLSILLFFLGIVLRFSHSSFLSARQRLINYCALAILFIVCWVGLEYFTLYIAFTPQEWQLLYPLLPGRIIGGLLVFAIAVSANKDESNDEREADEGMDKENTRKTDDNFENEPSVPEILERIAVKSGQKIEVIPVGEIICIHAEGDYVMIHTLKGKYLKEQTMKSLEAALPTDIFARVHRSSIVNIHQIAQIELFDKQTQLLKLKNGVSVKISMAGYRKLKNTLGL